MCYINSGGAGLGAVDLCFGGQGASVNRKVSLLERRGADHVVANILLPSLLDCLLQPLHDGL